MTSREGKLSGRKTKEETDENEPDHLDAIDHYGDPFYFDYECGHFGSASGDEAQFVDDKPARQRCARKGTAGFDLQILRGRHRKAKRKGTNRDRRGGNHPSVSVSSTEGPKDAKIRREEHRRRRAERRRRREERQKKRAGEEENLCWKRERTPRKTCRTTFIAQQSEGPSAADEERTRTQRRAVTEAELQKEQRARCLWEDVGRMIKDTEEVKWAKSLAALGEADRRFLDPEKDYGAQSFIKNFLAPVITKVISSEPPPSDKFGGIDCVKQCLHYALSVVMKDLHLKKISGDCIALEALSIMLNGQQDHNHSTYALEEFWKRRGFNALARYLTERASNSSSFPKLGLLIQPLSGLASIVGDNIPCKAPNFSDLVSDALTIAQSVTTHFQHACEEDYPTISDKRDVQRVVKLLEKMLSALAAVDELQQIYETWSGFSNGLIRSEAPSAQALGWETLNDLIRRGIDRSPYPKSFVVSGAGLAYINGVYDYVGERNDAGYAILHPTFQLVYRRSIPTCVPEEEGGGKTLTLFRCNMRSMKKWWFISEADEAQPGTDRDIDYYQRKYVGSQIEPDTEPPRDGWVTCRANAFDPPPTLHALGHISPEGRELDAMDLQLVLWAMKNGVIELLTNDFQSEEVSDAALPVKKFFAEKFNTHTIKTFLKHYPEGPLLLTKERRLPLHIAISWHKVFHDIGFPFEDWESAFRALLEAYPESLEYQDGKFGLYPFMLAASVPTIPLDTVYHLLRENPAIVCCA